MPNSRLFDLSRVLSPATPVWPGDPDVAVTPFADPGDADGFRLAVLTTGMHAGTHLDAPAHFLAGGTDVAGIPLDRCVGDAVLLRVAPVAGVVPTAALVAAWNGLAVHAVRVIVDTGFGAHFGRPDYFTAFPGFEPSLIGFLRERGIILFGVDLPSVKYGRDGAAAAHRDLLGDGIVIVETLALDPALPASFFFAAAPLRLAGMDGSPVRACAIADDRGCVSSANAL